MKWSIEQSKAIKTRDKNLLISASAGSGKTAVLVERIVELSISTGIDIDRFLVVTFTKAAAAEMKERISRAFVGKRVVYPEKIGFINKQISMLHNANVSTIDSFCKYIIKKYFYLLDIDPNFKIADSQRLQLLSMEALDDVMDTYYQYAIENREDVESILFRRAIKNYTTFKSDENFRKLILDVYSDAVVQPYPKRWLMMSEVDDMNRIMNLLVKDMLKEIDLYIEELELLIEISSESDGPHKYIVGLESDRDYFDRIYTKYSYLLADFTGTNLDENGLRGFLADISNIKYVKLSNILKTDTDIDINKKEYVKNKRDQIKSIAKKTLGLFLDTDYDLQLEIMKEAGKLHDLVSKITLDYMTKFEELKKRHNILDFADLEHYAIELLNQEELKNEVRQEFKFIFIDEYQDTNMVQEEISNLIRSDNNLFLVGDVKQSIYGFRKAEPKLFLEKFDRFKLEENSDRVDLNSNYRSSPTVLKSINAIFDYLMSKKFGDLNYANDAELIAGREDFKIEHKSAFHIVAIDEFGIDDENESLDSSIFDAYIDEKSPMEIEADYVVQRIEELLQEEIYDSRSGEVRKIRTSDIVILSRNMKGVEEVFKERLLKAGFSSSTGGESDFFEIIEINTVINMLRILDNVRQDVPLIAVMRSFLGGFSDAELYKLRNCKEVEQSSSFYDSMLQYVKINDDELSLKITGFLENLGKLRNLEHIKLSDKINLILKINNYQDYVKGLEGGYRRFYHLELLKEKAIDFEEEYDYELHSFINYLDKLNSSKIAYGSKSDFDVDKDAIRIMSIHKSKGLEFPVVLLVNTSKKFNERDLNSKIMIDGELKLASKFTLDDKYIQVPTYKYNLIKYKKAKEIKLEEQRLLYVAMTRAINRLECFSSMNSKEINELSTNINSPSVLSLLKNTSYSQWLTSIVPHVLGLWDMKIVYIRDIKTAMELSASPSDFGEVIYDRREILSASRTIKSELSQEISKTIQGELVDKDIRNFPSKIGVSELKKTIGIEELANIGIEEINLKDKLERSRLTKLIFEKSSNSYAPNKTRLISMEELKETKLKNVGAMRGNAYHHVMEEVVKEYVANKKQDSKYVYDKKTLEAYINSLVHKNIITYEEAKFVDIDKIMGFFESEYFQTLSKAEIVFLEKSFVYKLNYEKRSLLIQGVVDAIFVVGDKVYIVDYKTDALSEDYMFRERYRIQLYIYTTAISELLGLEVEKGVIYSFHLSKFIEL